MKLPIIILSILIGILIGAFSTYYLPQFINKKPLIPDQSPKPRPLDRYAFTTLSNTQIKPSEITLGKIIKEEKDYTSRVFYFYVDPQINSNQLKKVSGLINIPTKPGTYPILVMIRGFVEKEMFQTGMGTQRAGEYFAQNGFITLAPDFLGYGESENPSELAIEERFQNYVTVLTLLKSLPKLNSQLLIVNGQLLSDSKRIGLWAHSNGGQIAISTLEITGANYPTVLWAPVSKPFPYSILYYTDEFEDRGKALRKVVSDFEQDYDVEAYSPINFYDRIMAPIQLHQGTADDAIPLEWSNNLNKSLKDLNKTVEYFIYPGADHNLTPGWNEAIARSLKFYQENLNRD